MLAALHAIKNAVEKTNDKLDTLTNRVERLESSTNERLDHLSERIDSTNERLDTLRVFTMKGAHRAQRQGGPAHRRHREEHRRDSRARRALRPLPPLRGAQLNRRVGVLESEVAALKAR